VYSIYRQDLVYYYISENLPDDSVDCIKINANYYIIIRDFKALLFYDDAYLSCGWGFVFCSRGPKKTHGIILVAKDDSVL